MRRRIGWSLAAALWLCCEPASARPLRVMSLDQCADQYVLALAPDAELALTHRALSSDAWLRREARGRRILRPTFEAAMGFKPDVVVRYWGGDQRLLASLASQGVQVLAIDDATTMNGVEANVLRVADGLNQPERGRALVRDMRRKLAVADRPSSADRSALYLTPGGFTAGAGTLVDAIMRAAGFLNVAGPGFAPVSVERIVLSQPSRFVLGFYDQVRADWRGPGRHPVVRRVARGRIAARLPAAALTCPAWFAADAALTLAEQSS